MLLYLIAELSVTGLYVK